MIDSITQEFDRRRAMWATLLERGGPRRVTPAVLREIGIFGGGQGIYVDKERTSAVTRAGVGVTVAVLHTPGYEDDEVFADGVLYPYPQTARAAGRDRAETEATKALQRLGLPLFVIVHVHGGRRDVHLAWVEDWDDEAGAFLLSFGEAPVRALVPALVDGAPFRAFERGAADGGGQARFKFNVRRRYGPRCAFCDLGVSPLLDAAHIIPRSSRGSDDPRNGLVLCVLHRRALGARLVGIEPDSLELHYRSGGPGAAELGVTRTSIAHLAHKPHPVALEWLWEQWSARSSSAAPAGA